MLLILYLVLSVHASALGTEETDLTEGWFSHVKGLPAPHAVGLGGFASNGVEPYPHMPDASDMPV